MGWIIDVEHQATFTLNHLCHSSYRHNFEAFYRVIRSRKGLKALDSDLELDPYSPPRIRQARLPGEETRQEKRDRLVRNLESGNPTDIPSLLELIPGDDGDHAIRIVADVRAYWQSTFKHEFA